MLATLFEFGLMLAADDSEPEYILPYAFFVVLSGLVIYVICKKSGRLPGDLTTQIENN